MTTKRPAEFFHTPSSEMFDRIYIDYKQHSKAALSLIKHDRALSRFDAFNKRLKISCGLNISFSDDLDIVRDDTRSCYMLMYRISDIWYAFEHLLSVADAEIPRLSKSKIIIYPPDVLIVTGLTEVERIFGQLIEENVTREASWRRELYPMLAYFINNTNGGTRNALKECSARVKAKERFRLQELLAISYGLRNLYVHEGVMAAMGGRDYAFKRRLYEVVLDCLTLAAFTLGNNYAERVVTKWREKAVVGGAVAAQSTVADNGIGPGMAGSSV